MRAVALASLVAVAVGPLPAAAATVTVTIENMQFTPAAVNVHVGDTVEWTNKDFVAHSATANDKSFDVIVPAHKSGTLVVKAAGDFAYFCKFHPMMKGSIAAAGE
jgi:plastocyanin